MTKPDNQSNLVQELQLSGNATLCIQRLMQLSYPNPQGDQLNFNAHNIAMLNRLLGQMISVDNVESLEVSHQQFHQYMDALAESLELSQDGSNVLGQYEFYQGFLNDVYGLKYSEREQFLMAEGIEIPENADYWTSKIEQLKLAESESIFEERKEAILQELLESSEHKHIQSILLFGKLKKNVTDLVERRSGYLEENFSSKRLLKDTGWMVFGATILGTATFFGLAGSVFFIPAVILAGGVIAYSMVDTFRALTETDEEISNEKKIGARKLSELPEDLKDRYDIDNLLERRQSLRQKAKRDRLLFNALGTSVSIAGLGLAVIALLTVLPALAFPPALGIAVAVLSVATIGIAASILGVKVWRSIKANRELKAVSEKEFKSEMDTYRYLDTERHIECHQEEDILNALAKEVSSKPHEMKIESPPPPQPQSSPAKAEPNKALSTEMIQTEAKPKDPEPDAQVTIPSTAERKPSQQHVDNQNSQKSHDNIDKRSIFIELRADINNKKQKSTDTDDENDDESDGSSAHL